MAITNYLEMSTARIWICQHVDSKTAYTRQLAIACLGKLGPAAKSALPLVEKHLTDSDPEVKQVAEAVARILKGS